jgi:hypothetical protein
MSAKSETAPFTLVSIPNPPPVKAVRSIMREWALSWKRNMATADLVGDRRVKFLRLAEGALAEAVHARNLAKKYSAGEYK